jgi:DNA-binding transcriptional ArsR family regulator
MAKADCVEAEEGRLPARLVATMAVELQDALDHPARREILRVLNRSRRPQSLLELAPELSPYAPSQVRYHLQVLRQAGLVASERGYSGSSRGHDRYASEVSADAQVLSVLRATREADRERRGAAPERHSALPLWMFRLPRPGARTLRLRGRSRTEEDR